MNKLLVCSVTLMCVPLMADTIELKSGEKIEGKFKQAGADGATILVGGQPVTFALDKVQAIYLGNVPNAPQNAQPSSYSEALDALKALRSVTNSSVSYRDYAPRVLDAKVKVDKYLSSSEDGGNARRDSVRVAMQYYELAASAWNADITRSGNSLEVGRVFLANPALAECPTAQAGIAEARKMMGNKPTTMTEQISIGVIFGMRPALLWSCGSEKIDTL